jgi:hypothetical protein
MSKPVYLIDQARNACERIQKGRKARRFLAWVFSACFAVLALGYAFVFIKHLCK